MSLQDNSFTDMLQTVSSVQLPDRIKIVNNQSGGSINKPINKPTENIDKLLSMLTSDSNVSKNDETDRLENDLRNMLTLKGGNGEKSEPDPAKELQKFFQKYNIKTVNGIKSKYFIKNHTGDPSGKIVTETEITQTPTSATAAPSYAGDTSPAPPAPASDVSTPSSTSETSNTNSSPSLAHSGGAREMNPGFKAFIDLKKTIAEKLGIPNGPKAAKIAGSIQKEMKVKYPDLTSVQLAAKGLEHFNKDPSKYKKMV